MDLNDSAFEFHRVVWPAIRDLCGGGELIPVESVTETGFARQLDVAAGIDAWQLHTSEGLRGLASRVQWVSGSAWNTFTIRRQRDSGTATEYDTSAGY